LENYGGGNFPVAPLWLRAWPALNSAECYRSRPFRGGVELQQILLAHILPLAALKRSNTENATSRKFPRPCVLRKLVLVWKNPIWDPIYFYAVYAAASRWQFLTKHAVPSARGEIIETWPL